MIGDVNLHFDNDNDPYVGKLKKALHDRNLEQVVRVPTHVKGHILDWVITNANNILQDLKVDDRGLSDHFIITLYLRLSKPKHIRKIVNSRKIRDIDIASFRTDARASLQQPSSTDLSLHYTTCLRKLLDNYAPLTTRTVSDRPSAPWMSDKIKTEKKT